MKLLKSLYRIYCTPAFITITLLWVAFNLRLIIRTSKDAASGDFYSLKVNLFTKLEHDLINNFAQFMYFVLSSLFYNLIYQNYLA